MIDLLLILGMHQHKVAITISDDWERGKHQQYDL